MREYVIERDIPGAGKMTEDDIREVSVRSLEVLKSLGPQIQWLHSYVTDDRIYCVYLAPDEESIREHARLLGVPASRVSAVRRMIDPTTYGGPKVEPGAKLAAVKRMDEVLGLGFRDTVREVHPTLGAYSWWSNRGRARENDVGWRIDYILATPGIQVTRAEIEREAGLSDHAPVSIWVDM